MSISYVVTYISDRVCGQWQMLSVNTGRWGNSSTKKGYLSRDLCDWNSNASSTTPARAINRTRQGLWVRRLPATRPDMAEPHGFGSLNKVTETFKSPPRCPVDHDKHDFTYWGKVVGSFEQVCWFASYFNITLQLIRIKISSNSLLYLLFIFWFKNSLSSGLFSALS